MNEREVVECFHLLFSHRLSSKVDRSLFCLKGGCNLRFYFHSIRYSEDIDFDITTISVDTLKKHVTRLLNEDAFAAALRARKGVEIVEWSAPKQTATTQRWKVQIRVANQSISIPTKIEFSRRETEITGGNIDPVDAGLITQYQLQPVLIQHYGLSKAIEQKLGALINRNETQARDIIDLKMLKDRLSDSDPIVSLSKEDKEKAVEVLMAVSFDDFRSQVWPFLMGEYQDYYSSRDRWDRLQEEVMQFLESRSGGKT